MEDAQSGKEDAKDFPGLISQLSVIQSTLLVEHQKEVSSLREENRKLQERLDALESNGIADRSPSGQQHEATSGDIDLLIDGQLSPTLQVVPVSPLKTPSTQDSLVQKSHRSGSQDSPVKEQTLPNEDSPKKSGGDDAIAKKKPGIDDGMEVIPENANCFVRLVMNKWFEVSSGIVILANTLVMAMRLQYDAIGIGYDIGSGNFLQNAEETWPYADDVFYVVDVIFNIVFCIELFLRIAALGRKAPKSGWVWFDAIIIGVSAVDTFAGAALPVNPGMLRVLRLVRLVRLFKILKAMQSFDSLFLLLKAINASMQAAIWSFGILICVQLVVGLFLNQLMHTFMLEESNPLAARKAVYEYYGTFSITMLTMFEITMASWAKPCRVLVENVNEFFILFFIAYRCFFCFAVLKVIAAVFITETNRVLQHDDELTLMKIHREKQMFDKKVKNVLDTFQGRNIEWEDLQRLVHDEDVIQHLVPLGLSTHDLEKLFWLIDDGEGNVDIELFLHKLGSLRGGAKAINQLTLLKICQKIDAEVSHVFQQQGLMKQNRLEEEIEQQCCSL